MSRLKDLQDWHFVLTDFFFSQYGYKSERLLHTGCDWFNFFFPEALLLLSFIPDSACMMRSSMSEPSTVIYKMHKHIATAGNRKPLRKEGVKKDEDNVLFQCSD